MIKTECKRFIVHNNIRLPDEVQTKLDDWNKTHPIKLVLYFDEDGNKWQIYRLKAKGAIESEDILHWQISAPTEGTSITTGIFDWLKQYDTSQGGYLDQDDLRKNWLKEFKRLQEIQTVQKQKQQDDFRYGYLPIIQKLAVLREQVSVPKAVGWDFKKNSPILAVPKGTAKKMRKQEKRLKNVH